MSDWTPGEIAELRRELEGRREEEYVLACGVLFGNTAELIEDTIAFARKIYERDKPLRAARKAAAEAAAK